MEHQAYLSPILETIRKADFADDLELAHTLARAYTETVDDMPVFPSEESIKGLEIFDEALPSHPAATADILRKLGTYGAKATVAQTGGRYFGFVNGGIIPAALCSKWISDAWDQNSAMYVTSPVSSKLEEVCEKWLAQLLGLPENTAAGFVSGSSTATICGLLAARNELLSRAGFDAGKDGLFGAPPIRVIVGEGAHSTVFKALSILGLGHERVVRAPMDEQGRMRPELLPQLDNNTLLILQAGNVNTGAFDDFATLCARANRAGAWVHIDGAFGLWAAANPAMRQLTEGIALADSWSLDGHKTLNAPYDTGIIMCKRRAALVNALHMTGAYIVLSEKRDCMLYSTEMSRRARATDLWATLMGLGTQGVAELVQELHAKAVYFAQRLKENGLSILNDVCFNQVLAYDQSDEQTERIIRNVQRSGVCWFAGSHWDGRSVIRISVCSYKTTYDDIDICIDAILEAKKR